MVQQDTCTKELEVLHRSVRVINNELMEIEADQKHVPRLLEDLGLIQGNVVKTPRVKLSAIESNVIENSSILEGEQATLFRSGTVSSIAPLLDLSRRIKAVMDVLDSTIRSGVTVARSVEISGRNF